MLCEDSSLWPVRLRPLPEELFTGWLARLAYAQGLAPSALVSHLQTAFRLNADRDLDTEPSYELLAEVGRRTAVPYARLVVMTIRWHVHPWYARYIDSDRWLTFGFCPQCWAADPIPYVRRIWRLRWMACQIHQVPFRWECPRCKASPRVRELRNELPLWQCENCKSDLRKAPSAQWSPSADVTRIFEWQRNELCKAEQRYLNFWNCPPEPQSGEPTDCGQPGRLLTLVPHRYQRRGTAGGGHL